MASPRNLGQSIAGWCSPTGLRRTAILSEAFRAAVPVIDLRLVCTEAGDYSKVSPIEPSAVGGGKIAGAIARVLAEHDFMSGGSRVFS